MKVILLTELKGRGGEGDVIEVARGFYNNYLGPRGMAVLATKGNLKQLEQRKGNIAKREAQRLADAEALKAVLAGKTVKVIARVGEEGVLFGSVTDKMIAEAIQAELGVEIDRKRLEVKGAIKTAGEHEIALSIYRDIKAELTILVGENFEAEVAEEVAEVEEVAEETEEAAE